MSKLCLRRKLQINAFIEGSSDTKAKLQCGRHLEFKTQCTVESWATHQDAWPTKYFKHLFAFLTDQPDARRMPCVLARNRQWGVASLPTLEQLASTRRPGKPHMSISSGTLLWGTRLRKKVLGKLRPHWKILSCSTI